MNPPSNTPAERQSPLFQSVEIDRQTVAEPHRPSRIDIPDDRSGSPLFWLHYAIKEGLEASALRSRAMKMKPSSIRGVMFSGAAAIDAEADRSWKCFCGRYR